MSTPPTSHTSRLISVDALRGLAALAVVASHVSDERSHLGSASVEAPITRILAEWMDRGRVGVVLFFVISGFCIHLRRAKAQVAGASPRIDFASFWRKRFIRLYPPYLVALGLYLAIQTATGQIEWGRFKVYDLFMHLFMLHNLDGRTVFNIEAVFWTLAIEEQLYLAYFLLLPLRDRLGWFRTLAICLAARVGWFGVVFVVGHGDRTGFHLLQDVACLSHWFSWALGAVAVEAALGLIRLPAWAARFWCAGLCFALAIGCDYVTGQHLGGGIGWRLTWLFGSPIWGLGFFVLVNRLVLMEAGWREAGQIPRPITVLAGVGLFSYSLYLIHDVVLRYLGPPLLNQLGLANGLWERLLLVGPAIGLAWLFFLICERPFLHRATRVRFRPAGERPIIASTTLDPSRLEPGQSPS